MIDFNVELIGELCIHGFNHLPNRIVEATKYAVTPCPDCGEQEDATPGDDLFAKRNRAECML